MSHETNYRDDLDHWVVSGNLRYQLSSKSGTAKPCWFTVAFIRDLYHLISLSFFINGLDNMTEDSLSIFIGGQDTGGQISGKVAQRYLDKWRKKNNNKTGWQKKKLEESKIIKKGVPEVECLCWLGTVCLSSSTAVGPGDPPEVGQRQHSKTAARETLTINATERMKLCSTSGS